VAFGSMEDVFDAICTGSAEGCRAPVMVEGGKRVKKRRSLGCRLCARLMWACIEAIVAVCWCVYGYTAVARRSHGDFDIDVRSGVSLTTGTAD
jgi:hypothetical protein